MTEKVLIGGGVTQVPGTREWMISSRWPMGVDRSMANTFFRPSYSPGFMSIGSLFEDVLHYHAGVYNGIEGGVAGLLRDGTSMAWAGNLWLEPLWPFGLGYSDMEHHRDLVLRVGTSGTYALTPATIVPDGLGFSNPENTVVRLSDGTPIAEPGALGSGSSSTHHRRSTISIPIGQVSPEPRSKRSIWWCFSGMPATKAPGVSHGAFGQPRR